MLEIESQRGRNMPPLPPSPVQIRGTRRQLLRKLGMLGALVLAGCEFGTPVDSSRQSNTPAVVEATPEPGLAPPDLATATPVSSVVTSTSTLATPEPTAKITEPAVDLLEPAVATPEPIADEPVCVLTPQATAGPYYFDTGLMRRDIVEDRVGTPLQMAVRIVRVDHDCEPLEGAFVDLWHADAAGVYSGYPGQLGGLDTSGRTFLRGVQATGTDGIASFDTIYPGWYPSRTVHIHFKVHYENNAYVTSQFYFPDEVSDRAFERSPYSRRPNRTVRNANDSVLRGDPSEGNLLANITEDSAGYTGAITVGVVL